MVDHLVEKRALHDQIHAEVPCTIGSGMIAQREPSGESDEPGSLGRKAEGKEVKTIQGYCGY